MLQPWFMDIDRTTGVFMPSALEPGRQSVT